MNTEPKALLDKKVEEARAINHLLDESEFYDQKQCRRSWAFKSINHLKRRHLPSKGSSYLGLLRTRVKSNLNLQKSVTLIKHCPATNEESSNLDYETYIKKNKSIEKRRGFFSNSFKERSTIASMRSKVIIYPKKLIKKKATLLHQQKYDLVHDDEESKKKSLSKADRARVFPSPGLSSYKRVFLDEAKNLSYLRRRIECRTSKPSICEETSPTKASKQLTSVAEKTSFHLHYSKDETCAHLPISKKNRRDRYQPFIPYRRASNSTERKKPSRKAIALRNTSDPMRSSGMYGILKLDSPPRQYHEKVRSIHQLGRRARIHSQ